MRLRLLISIHIVLGLLWPALSRASGIQLAPGPAQRALAVSAITIQAPALVNATEGDTISITATAGSGDFHSILQIQLQGQPPGLTLTYGGFLPAYATLSGILQFDTAGTWILSWTVRDQFGAYDSTATYLVIRDNPNPVNLPPLADIGGPYGGVLGVPVEMDATGSYDPEGAPLTYAWDFGDGVFGLGGTVSHLYVNTGTYHVSVVVSDGFLSDQDETNVVITNDLLGYAFVTRGDRELRLDSDKPWFCFGVEPLNGNFRTEDVQLGFNLYWATTLISSTGKTSAGEDRNHNGIPEVTTCFSKEYLRELFSRLSPGTHEVPVTLEGWHVAGNRILASMTLTVVTRKASTLSIYPNPFNPVGVVTFTTSAVGPVRVRIFDVSGRLVRTLMDSDQEPAGAHSIPIEGRDRNDNPLASGVYFIRVETGVRSETIRAVVAR